MSLKRVPTDDEINSLAEHFRTLWTPGDVVRPWFRKHREMMLELVHGAWSWAAIARALTKAGITYRTGKPWTAKWLQSDFSRAQVPLKGYARRRAVDVKPSQDGQGVATESQYPAALSNDISTEPDEPEFKPASFIDWDAKRKHEAGGKTNGATPTASAGSQRYEEVMAQLTGKKPSY